MTGPDLICAGAISGGRPYRDLYTGNPLKERTGQIQRIVVNERWEELRREPMVMELGQRIRDIRQGPEGLFCLLTAEEDGALLRIEPR